MGKIEPLESIIAYPMSEAKPYIRYTSGRQYRSVQVSPNPIHLLYVRPLDEINTVFCTLSKDGYLYSKGMYSWDGPSGPAKFFRSLPFFGRAYPIRKIMRASFWHDMLAELMRMDELPHYFWPEVDMEYIAILKEDGVMNSRIYANKKGLAQAKGKYALPESKYKVYTAPI